MSTKLVTRATSAIVRKPQMVLALIVVLCVALISAVVRYRGLLWFGPYPKGKRAKVLASASATPPGDADTSETDQLIDSINKGSQAAGE
jgi:hypothetical protein